MAHIPEAELERLKREVSLLRLIQSQGQELKKRGKGTLNCTTTTCENYKFELIDRCVRALESLDEVYGVGAIVVGGIAGMAGAGGSRPGAGVVPGASSNVNKAYEYWAAVKLSGLRVQKQRLALKKRPAITSGSRENIGLKSQSSTMEIKYISGMT